MTPASNELGVIVILPELGLSFKYNKNTLESIYVLVVNVYINACGP